MMQFYCDGGYEVGDIIYASIHGTSYNSILAPTTSTTSTTSGSKYNNWVKLKVTAIHDNLIIADYCYDPIISKPSNKGKLQPAYATQFHQRKGGDPSAKPQRLKLPYALIRNLPRERPALKPGNYG